MIRDTAKTEHESFDILVVGGGMFGACAAHESEAGWTEARTRAEVVDATEFFAWRGATRAFDGRPAA